MIFEKNKLNKRRYGKNKVLAILNEGIQLNEKLTNGFESLEIDWIGHPKIYDYGESVLYVHGCDSIKGKGDVYSYDEINRLLKGYRSIKLREKRLKSLGNRKWDVLSKHGSDMINHIPALLDELAIYLNVPVEKLDFTYKSLDMISNKINQYELLEEIISNYDNIYIYIGEVFKKRSNGVWSLKEEDGIPYIDIGVASVQYIPLNVLGEAIWTKGNLNLKKLVIAEYKRFSNRLSCMKNNARNTAPPSTRRNLRTKD